MPLRAASWTTYSSAGVVTIGASSFGTDFVNGRKRVPRPAAGMSALRTREGLGMAWTLAWPHGHQVVAAPGAAAAAQGAGADRRCGGPRGRPPRRRGALRR